MHCSDEVLELEVYVCFIHVVVYDIKEIILHNAGFL